MNVRTKPIAYWGTTGVAALVLGMIGTADLLHVPAIMESLTHLGYPTYFPTILGAWTVLGAAAILAPAPVLLQEWAYAGMFFTLTGAALSHAASGDPVNKVLVPLTLLGLIGCSWALRPARRALQTAELVARRAA
jgi:hypothetical protein